MMAVIEMRESENLQEEKAERPNVYDTDLPGYLIDLVMETGGDIGPSSGTSLIG
jgi:hypothetical protein